MFCKFFLSSMVVMIKMLFIIVVNIISFKKIVVGMMKFKFLIWGLNIMGVDIFFILKDIVVLLYFMRIDIEVVKFVFIII